MPGATRRAADCSGWPHPRQCGVDDEAGRDEKSVKILVVDDDKLTRDVVTLYLAKRGWSVQTAATLEEAENRLSREAFAVVVTDLNLGPAEPRQGFRVAQTALNTPGTRIVLLTGESVELIAGEARRNGIAAVLPKPSSFQALSAIVSELIRESAAGLS